MNEKQVLLTLLIMTVLFGFLVGGTKRDINKNSQFIGEKIVLKGDTLTVKSYNWFMGDFKLSNGEIVGEGVIISNKLK